jgi:hypothetical protein
MYAAPLLLVLSVFISVVWTADPGQPFPKPQSLTQTDRQFYLDPRGFTFAHAQDSVVCDLITNAFSRYYKIIFNPEQYAAEIGSRQLYRSKPTITLKPGERNIDQLDRVIVKVKTECEDYPSIDSDESCKKNQTFKHQVKLN